MDDLELVERAAKAAGIDPDMAGPNTPREWNPLTDDGDAPRLAVKLKLEIWQGREEALCGDNRNPTIREPYGADPYAATRRAIVRAAASLPADTQG